MSDREPLPVAQEQRDQASAENLQQQADAFMASPARASQGAAGGSLAESEDEPAPPARRNWDRLTYGGIGGWFKRLFSSAKRAKHRGEIDERRQQWSRDVNGLREDPMGYRPNLSLLRSNWARRQNLDTLGREGRRRFDFWRDRAGDVDDDALAPGPSHLRPPPMKSALKPTAFVPQVRNLDRQQQNQIDEFTQDKRTVDEAEHAAWEAMPDKNQPSAAYEDAAARGMRRDQQSQTMAGSLNWLDQGELAFPEGVSLVKGEGRQRALAFHQGYWKREQQAPKPTSKAKGTKKVRFDMGSDDVEPLLNTPGNMPDEGEVVSLTDDGNPMEGRILPTGAFEYPAADPSLYGQYSAPLRTQFNRLMATNPDLLGEAKRDMDPTYSAWAKKVGGMRNRPSQSANSRAKRRKQEAEADPATRAAMAAEEARLNAVGAGYHMTRDEGMVQPPQSQVVRAQSVSSQEDLESNQAHGSEMSDDDARSVDEREGS